VTGKIISFQSHRDLKRGELHREQTVPRHASAARNAQILKRQVAHIAHLLEELEELACTVETGPPATLKQARASLEKARPILPPVEGSGRTAQRAGDSAGEPQPEIDDEELERMYLDLYSGA
jgi:hypothetical protein